MRLIPATNAMKVSLRQQFQALEGVAPYTYAVLPGGAGGLINASTGMYTAPLVASPRPDIIEATDANGTKAQAVVNVLTPLGLLADIIRQYMGLASNRVWIYDQEINEPKGVNDLYVILGVVTSKPFGFSGRRNGVEFVSSVNVSDMVSVDIKSKNTDALYRKEEVLMALTSQYAQQQYARNSFKAGPLSTSFVNLSNLDGAAIPYRFNISINLQYSVVKGKVASYYDQFEQPEVITDPQ